MGSSSHACRGVVDQLTRADSLVVEVHLFYHRTARRDSHLTPGQATSDHPLTATLETGSV
jgi:hypothetical protein